MFLYADSIGQYVVPVLMGYALWLSRIAPRWLAALFASAKYIAEIQSSGGPIVVLYMLPSRKRWSCWRPRVLAAKGAACQPVGTVAPSVA